MKKRKFFSYLFLGLLTVGATGMVTSCKDYDDDIDNLQSQIDKAALQSDVDGLKSTLSTVEATANAALPAATAAATYATQADLKTVSDVASKTSTDLATLTSQLANYATVAQLNETNGNVTNAQNAADKAQSAADVAQKAAEAAQKTADDALTAAKAAQTTADNAATKDALEAVAKAAQEAADKAQKAAEAAQSTASSAVTQTQLTSAVSKAIEDAQAAQKTINDAATSAIAEVRATANAAATKTELQNALSRVSTLEAQSVTAAQLKEKLDSVDEVIKLIDTTDGSNLEAVKQLTNEVANYKASVNALYKAVTGVELFGTYTGNGKNWSKLSDNEALTLDLMRGTVGKNSKFGDNEAYAQATPIYEFKSGDEFRNDAGIIVRVNPLNADLTTAKIVLVNSQGEVLNAVEAGTPVRFNELITKENTTRANIESGLWTINFHVANGYTEEDFLKETTADTKTQKNDILYAVAINNTDSAADRYVASTYDVAPKYNEYVAARTFDFKVNDVWAEEIHNRWDGTETKSEDAVKTSDKVPELKWAASTSSIETPDTGAVKTGDKKNVVNAGSTTDDDARYSQNLLPVEVGEEFDVVIADKEDATTKNADKIKYYYVTLDKDRAIESTVSEWNAWAGYDIDGLYTNVPNTVGSKITLKINSASANTDIIGFRVYAVNYDGTLADPDGRAFYVQVGEAANTENVVGNDTIVSAAATNVNGSVAANFTYGDNVVILPLTKEFQSSTNNLFGYVTLDETSKANIGTKGESSTDTQSLVYKLLDEDQNDATDWKDAKYIMLGVYYGGQWKDGSTLNGTITTSSAASTATAARVLNTINVSLTKVLPTSDNTTLRFRPNQNLSGSNQFYLYMIPGTNATTTASTVWAATTIQETGVANLNNTFYGIENKDIVFTFADAKDGENNTVVSNATVTGTPDANGNMTKVLTEAAKYITAPAAQEWHNVTAAVNYGKISSEKKDAGGNLVAYTVNLNQTLQAKFVCWESANKYEWTGFTNTNKRPSIAWNAEGNYTATNALTSIKNTNSYDKNRFSGTLGALVTTNKFLVLQDDAELRYYESGSFENGGQYQTNPYVVPSINSSTGVISYTNTQTLMAPTADHAETLVLHLKDVYNHDVYIGLLVDITRP